MNRVKIRRILFGIFVCGISQFCHSGNGIAVGLFRLTRCSGNLPEYSISMNKDADTGGGYESFHIPSQIVAEGEIYRVVQIAKRGFTNCCFIKNLVIDEGIKEVANQAFDGCSDLCSVSFPSTLSSLGECIFSGCPELKTIEVNQANPTFDSRERCNAVIRTADNAVEMGCAGTTFPKSVSKISPKAFCGCTGLTSLNVPKWIENIGAYAFADCFRLKEIILPEDCTLQFGQSAFDGCCALTSFNLPAGDISFFEGNPFTNCENLSCLTVSPKNRECYVNKEKNALICDSILFVGCYNTTIGSDIKRIYTGAFKGCRRLTKIFIPASVVSIDADVFSGCKNLVSVAVDKGNKVYDSREDCNCIIESQSNKIVCGSSVAVIPKSVTSIGKYAFCAMNTPETLRIPDNVLEVDMFAFMRCNDLCQLIIPANTKLNWESFFGCNRLTSVIYEPVNKYVRTKKDLTFRNTPFLACRNLVSISISGENVPAIDYGQFVNRKSE